MSEGITLAEFCSPRVEVTRNGMDANGQYHPDKNQQLHVNDAKSVQLAEEYLADANALHNAQMPTLAIRHEKSQHRLVLVLKLRGLSNREIARQMEMSEPWVSQITRQPWFQAQLVAALSNAQEEVIDKIVKVEAVNSIFKLVQLRDTAESEAVQADCAKEILNRHLGKPVSRTETTANVFHVTAKMEDIDKQLQEVEAEEKRLLRLDIVTEPEPTNG